MLKIGVLGLQGAVEEHIRQINALNAEGIIIKRIEQLEDIDGLILPGGESTAIRKLMDLYGFVDRLKEFKKPIFGTCAGMVLLAKDISESAEAHLSLMDITVKRNAFGRQRFSFEINLSINGLDEPFQAVFIRAPYALAAGPNVEILATYKERIVAARQGNLLVSAFHPELTDDTRFMNIFLEMVESSLNVSEVC